jgi:Tat protein secretion system quality control protein TatD with DNase activity
MEPSGEQFHSIERLKHPMQHLFAVLFGLILAPLLHAQPASWGTPVGPRPESESLAQSVPIADVHMHFDIRHQTVEQMLRRVQENNVRWGGGVGDYASEMQAAWGPNYIPALGQAEFTKVLMTSGESALVNPEHPVFVRLFQEAEDLIASGKARGFGEIHINNRTNVAANDPFGRSIPLDSPVVRRMYEIAEQHSGFVQIHYNKDPRTVEQIPAMAKRYPKTITIVAHCMPVGIPDDMRRIFNEVQNVMCELSGATHIHGIKRIVTPEGINSRWLQLIEDFPDRVMMGSDPCCGLMRRYSEIIKVMRTNALASMKPETLEKVAYKNALRVFGLKD